MTTSTRKNNDVVSNTSCLWFKQKALIYSPLISVEYNKDDEYTSIKE